MKSPNRTRFIFVTGGVVSSLGKGIAAASIGQLLVATALTGIVVAVGAATAPRRTTADRRLTRATLGSLCLLCLFLKSALWDTLEFGQNMSNMVKEPLVLRSKGTQPHGRG